MSRVQKTRRDPKHDFLIKSAAILRRNAPSTSAFLSAESVALLFHEQGSIPEYEKQRVCLACGWLQSTFEEPEATRNGVTTSRIQTRPTSPGTGSYTCQRCNRVTRFIPTSKAGNVNVKQHAPNFKALSHDAASPAETTTLAKDITSTGHKRAKARKQNTLQALLNKSKKDSGAQNTGLEFMDFMKAA